MKSTLFAIMIAAAFLIASISFTTMAQNKPVKDSNKPTKTVLTKTKKPDTVTKSAKVEKNITNKNVKNTPVKKEIKQTKVTTAKTNVKNRKMHTLHKKVAQSKTTKKLDKKNDTGNKKMK
jgi:hypothetical protein